MKTLLFISTIFSFVYLGYGQNVSKQPLEELGDFDGIYFEVNVGSQNVFGGSFVNDMDMLAQESKLVTEVGIGFRKQFANNRLVAGLAYSIGFLNGNLEHVSSDESLKIDYENSTQNSFGLISGILIGQQRRLLLFTYLNETKRKFHVVIDQPPYNYTQRDKQGMLKYGGGLEYQVFKRLHFKVSYGGLRVDFGELKTNINVEDKFDLIAGVVYQL